MNLFKKARFAAGVLELHNLHRLSRQRRGLDVREKSANDVIGGLGVVSVEVRRYA